MIQRPAPVLTAAEQAAVHPKRELPPRSTPRIMKPDQPPKLRPVAQPCCATWAESQQEGHDGEAWGPLFWHEDDSETVTGGTDLPPVRFCPWCAAPKLPATV